MTMNTAIAEVRNIDVADIIPVGNPRTHFDEQALRELAESIRTKGLLQPIVVRTATGTDAERVRYALIAGERLSAELE